LQANQDTNPGALIEALRVELANRTPVVQATDGAMPAGVLVPLHFHDNAWHVILNVRSQHVSNHQGEISFPGGKLEPEDTDMTTCALRESWEEMGIKPEDVDVLGAMDATLTRTNFLVWPTVGVVPHPYDFQPDPREVAEVLEIPLHTMLDGTAVRHEARLNADGTVRRRVAYGHNGHLVFGATAWILSDLLGLINKIGTATGNRSLATGPRTEEVTP
jgi:8-oxo-dGTP pyrophosphatase MutT (NUDIX family)